jgi:E3 ubiquitin-protein ligase DOA10
MEPLSCRICSEEDTIENLIAPCKCNGSSKYVHRECLDAWRNRDGIGTKNFKQCYVCGFTYGIEKLKKNEIEKTKEEDYSKKMNSEYIFIGTLLFIFVISLLILPYYISIFIPLLFIYCIILYICFNGDILNNNYLYFDYIVLTMYLILILSIDRNYSQSKCLIATTFILTIVLFYCIYQNYIISKQNYYRSKIWKNIAYDARVIDYGITGPTT